MKPPAERTSLLVTPEETIADLFGRAPQSAPPDQIERALLAQLLGTCTGSRSVEDLEAEVREAFQELKKDQRDLHKAQNELEARLQYVEPVTAGDTERLKQELFKRLDELEAALESDLAAVENRYFSLSLTVKKVRDHAKAQGRRWQTFAFGSIYDVLRWTPAATFFESISSIAPLRHAAFSAMQTSSRNDVAALERALEKAGFYTRPHDATEAGQ